MRQPVIGYYQMLYHEVHDHGSGREGVVENAIYTWFIVQPIKETSFVEPFAICLQ